MLETHDLGLFPCLSVYNSLSSGSQCICPCLDIFLGPARFHLSPFLREAFLQPNCKLLDSMNSLFLAMDDSYHTVTLIFTNPRVLPTLLDYKLIESRSHLLSLCSQKDFHTAGVEVTWSKWFIDSTVASNYIWLFVLLENTFSSRFKYFCLFSRKIDFAYFHQVGICLAIVEGEKVTWMSF